MKKILLAIGIFLINYSGISQSNSCTISISNITHNTLCYDYGAGVMPNGSFIADFMDSVIIDGTNISYSTNTGNLFGYNTGNNGEFSFNGVEPGSYTLTMTYDDGNGYTCTASTTINIQDNSTSYISVSQGFVYNPSCENSNTGAFDIEVYGGQPPYDYSISSNGNFIRSGTSFNNNIFIDTISAGIYDYEVIDANYCYTTSNSWTFPAYVVEYQITTSQDTICEGDIVTLSENNGALVTWPDFSNNDIYSFSPSQSGFYSGIIDDDSLGYPYYCYDSVYIEVLNNSTFSEVLTLCDSIVWNGVTYDSSGVYSDTLQNSLGCDSILILDVTFVQPTYGNETLTACDSVTWNGITYDSSGTFIETIPNHLGCDSIVTIDVNLVGDYDMRFLVSPVSLIAPPFIFPFINATPNLVNYDFTWDFGDGTVIATNDTNITHEYQYNGVYTVKLIAEDMVNNCGIDSLEKPNLINCSGGPSLHIEEAYKNLVLYPNPARYIVNIDYGTEDNFNNHYVEIINSIGQQVFLTTIDASNIQIPVSYLGSKGLYFINIRNEINEIIVTKHLIIN